MALVSLQSVNVGFGGPLLLEGVDLSIDRGERVCLVGRNGTGKSTILRLLTGEVKPDGGRIVYQQGVRITLLTQEVPHDITGSVFDVVSSAFGEQGKLLAAYHHVSARLAHEHSEKLMAELEDIQHKFESAGGWQMQQKVEEILTRLQLPEDAEFSALSGGLKRRVLLAKALAGAPDLLLLDEPTNHLDIEAISWLEEFLLTFGGTLLFVTHDRALLQKLATRIIDLDRGRLTSWPGSYQAYLDLKQAALDAESVENAKFDKKLAAEEVWIRQGVKARRTRNEGRVRALKELRRIRSERREKIGTAVIQMQEAERTGKLVIEATKITYAYDNKPVISDFSTTIIRGDKIGIIGPNGSGKTTLLKLLLGSLKPQQGSLRLGTNLEVAYLDQHRAQLDDEKTVQDNVAYGSDHVTVNGNRRHVIGYLADFLFAPATARDSPVTVAVRPGSATGCCSQRLLPSRRTCWSLTRPPTTSTSIRSIARGAPDRLPGTVLLVSHDRAFINNVVTSTLVLEGQGKVSEYVGGYDDWLRQSRQKSEALSAPARTEEKKTAPASPKEKPRKLTFKEQKELETLPQKIEELDAEQQRIIATMADPAFYRESGGNPKT